MSFVVENMVVEIINLLLQVNLNVGKLALIVLLKINIL